MSTNDDIDFLAGSFPIRQPVVMGPNDNLSDPSPQRKPPLASQTFGYSHQPFNTSDPSTELPANLDAPQPLPPGYAPVSYFTDPLPPREQVTMLEKISLPMKIGNPSYMGISCIDISNHIADCPVCSKLHKSNSYIYIGIILILIIIILFLGKKFFD